jgi:hypothetical protein
MAGSLQPIPKLVHPVLGLTDFHLYPERPLYMGRQGGSVPSDTFSPNFWSDSSIRRSIYATIFGVIRGTVYLLFGNHGFGSVLIYRPRPTVYVHSSLAQNPRRSNLAAAPPAPKGMWLSLFRSKLQTLFRQEPVTAPWICFRGSFSYPIIT